jgi:DNA-binding response OmpR family regulator
MPKVETSKDENKIPGAAERPKVLLLEDDPYFFEFYGNRLRGGDFEVISEADEDEGIKRVLKEKPDAIILDINLPKEDDFSFIANLKKYPEVSSIPVVILTDLSDEESKRRGLALGASEYLIRDEISFHDIIESVNKVIKNKI